MASATPEHKPALSIGQQAAVPTGKFGKLHTEVRGGGRERRRGREGDSQIKSARESQRHGGEREGGRKRGGGREVFFG